uniref:Uncharacterized protein n=1 Tax=Nothoprocta perdicaria TaxID=30464 RepID=A0A8C6Z4T7_NOTPE
MCNVNALGVYVWETIKQCNKSIQHQLQAMFFPSVRYAVNLLEIRSLSAFLIEK